MSISSSGVKISKRKKGTIILALFTIIELVFSVLLVVSLASNLLFPQRASAVAGVSAKLSYQGRLTDLSGNPLGGSGTNYCFRFSIFDAASGGTKQWPAGAPNSTTVKVEDGVFNTDIGTADSLATFDFSSVDTLYLNVEVNATPTTCGGSWEQLDLRQRIDSVGYARAAEGVYSSLLRAPTGGTAVQIGTGAGATTPIFLNLDVENIEGSAVDSSCSTNGQMWYNSFDSKARICQGSVIRDLIDGILVKDEGVDKGRASTALDFTGGGVSASKGAGGVININVPDRIGGIAVNAASTVTNGSVVFSNSNGVTFGMAGSTITASVAAGAAPTLIGYQNMPRESLNLVTNMTATGVTQRPLFFPFELYGNLVLNNIGVEVSRATSGSNLFTIQAAIYTFVNSTQISRLASLQNVFSNTATASISGVRQIRLTGLEAAGTSLTPGQYVMMLYASAANTASMNYSWRGAVTALPPVGNIFPGTNSVQTATSQLSSNYLMPFQGRYTATTASPPGFVNRTQVQGWTSIMQIYFRMFST